jgi:hypothetical protein
MYLFLTYIYCVESVDCRLSRSVAMISSGSVCLVKMLRRDSLVFLHKHDDLLHTISLVMVRFGSVRFFACFG